jgi:hypothetical protein
LSDRKSYFRLNCATWSFATGLEVFQWVVAGLNAGKRGPFHSLPLPPCLLQVELKSRLLFFMLILRSSFGFKCPRTSWAIVVSCSLSGLHL